MAGSFNDFSAKYRFGRDAGYEETTKYRQTNEVIFSGAHIPFRDYVRLNFFDIFPHNTTGNIRQGMALPRKGHEVRRKIHHYELTA